MGRTDRNVSGAVVRCAIYVRQSLVRSGERAVSIGTQLDDCRALAERLGWEIVDEFADPNRSAWQRNRKRPGWDQLMEGLARRDYDAVVVWHGDRLLRQPRDLEDLLDIADQGVKVASPQGERNLSDPDDRFVLRIEVAHACRSSDDTARRVRRGHQRLAAEGRRPGGGSRPYGYACIQSRRDREPGAPDVDRRACQVVDCPHDGQSLIRHEADLIRDAARRLLAGESLRSLVADWNDRGVPSATGKQWKTNVVSRMMTDYRLAGWRSHHGVITAKGQWPAILERHDIDRLRAILLDPERRTNGNPRRYLLSGLLVCGHDDCGAKLVARPRDDSRRAYVCARGPNFTGCGKLGRLAEPVEGWVVAQVLDAIGSPAFVARAPDDPDADELADIERCETKLAELAAEWAADRITRDEWAAARDGIAARMSAARSRLAANQATRERGDLVRRAGTIRGDWENYTFGRRRAIVETVVDRVVVLPAIKGYNRFDPSRILIEWRA